MCGVKVWSSWGYERLGYLRIGEYAFEQKGKLIRHLSLIDLINNDYVESTT